MAGGGRSETVDVGGRLLLAVVDYASFRLGPKAAQDVFATATAAGEMRQPTDIRGWVSLDTFHAVADAYRPHLGDSFIRDAIAWAVPIRREFSAMSMTALMTPDLMYRYLDRARSFFAHHLQFEVTPRGRGHLAVELRYRTDVPRRRDSCDVGWGVLQALPLLFEEPAAQVAETACYANGADACRYEVRFHPRKAVALPMALVGAALATAGMVVLPSSWWLALPFAGLLVGRELGVRRQRRHMVRVTEDQRRLLEENERDFERRFRDLETLNAELELRVADRTQQLEASMRELREQNAEMQHAVHAMHALRAGIVDEGVRRLSPSVQMVAHELKNPLSVLVSNLDFLESASEPSGDPSKTELGGAVRDAREGLDRVREVLDWFVDLHREEWRTVSAYDVEAELDGAIRLHARAPFAAGTTVHRAFGGVGAVEGYGKQLTQVFSNLLNNAAQSPGTKNIYVETRVVGERVVITVTDDGGGIDAKVLARLFERGATTKGSGSGLGLYISQAIVARHGGEIRAGNDAKRGGARFTVDLPRRPPPSLP